MIFWGVLSNNTRELATEDQDRQCLCVRSLGSKLECMVYFSVVVIACSFVVVTMSMLVILPWLDELIYHHPMGYLQLYLQWYVSSRQIYVSL